MRLSYCMITKFFSISIMLKFGSTVPVFGSDIDMDSIFYCISNSSWLASGGIALDMNNWLEIGLDWPVRKFCCISSGAPCGNPSAASKLYFSASFPSVFRCSSLLEFHNYGKLPYVSNVRCWSMPGPAVWYIYSYWMSFLPLLVKAWSIDILSLPLSYVLTLVSSALIHSSS